MKKHVCLFMLITGVMSLLCFNGMAQSWEMPQDNKPKATINWATPVEQNLDFDYPFKAIRKYRQNSIQEYYVRQEGTYTVRIPNRFTGSGLATNANQVTWAIGNPDVSAGYTETKISFSSLCTEHFEGDVIFNSDVIINGTKAFPKGPSYTWKGIDIGHSCYSSLSTEKIYSDCGSFVQFVYNSDTELYYQFVKARNASNTIILWGIFSTASRYKR